MPLGLQLSKVEFSAKAHSIVLFCWLELCEVSPQVLAQQDDQLKLITEPLVMRGPVGRGELEKRRIEIVLDDSFPFFNI